MGLKIKVSKNGKIFASRTVTSGRVQKAFAEQIGKPVGGCVAAGVKKGMKASDIRKVVKDCAAKTRGTKLKF